MKKTFFLVFLVFFIKNLSCLSNNFFDLEKINRCIDFDNPFFKAEVYQNDKVISLDIAFLFHKKANQIIINEIECNNNDTNHKSRKFLSIIFSNISFSIDSLSEIYLHDGSSDLSVVLPNNCKKTIDSKICIRKQRLTFLITTSNKKTWFYFDFNKNRLNTISSNSFYNEIVIKTSKVKSNNYRYVISTKYAVDNFIRYMIG